MMRQLPIRSLVYLALHRCKCFLPFAIPALYCPLIQNIWPMVRSDSTKNHWFLPYDHHEWTIENISIRIILFPNEFQQSAHCWQLIIRKKNALFDTSNSGGPSSASSLDCSSPILLRSHTCKRLSVPLLANIVSLCGDHWTWKISSLWDSKECNFNLRFLKSQSATVLSALPVARINSEYGLKLKQFTSAVWASTVWLGLLVLLHLSITKICTFYRTYSNYWNNYLTIAFA